MKYWILILSIFVLYSCNDKKTASATENTNATDTTNITEKAPKADVEFPQALENGTLVFHAIIGVKDTIGGPRIKYKRDMINYNLNKKFAFVDKNSAVFVTDQPDTVDVKNLHQYAQYIMKMHVYFDSVVLDV